MLPDGFAEGFAFLCVTHRIVEGGLADAERPGGHLDAADLETAHHLGPALVRHTTQDGVVADPAAVEDQLTRFHTAIAELGEFLRDHQAVTGLDQQHTHPLVRRLRIAVGDTQQTDQAGMRRIGDPGLRPRDRPHVAVAGRGRPHGLEVAAAPGSVSAMVARIEPSAIFGRYFAFCSSVPNVLIK